MACNTIKICVFMLFFYSVGCTAEDNKTVETSSLASPSVDTSPIAPNNASECRPGCKPANYTADVVTLKNAMDGLGTDTFSIVELLASRNNNERQQLRYKFKDLYQGQDLIKELKSELGGNLAVTVEALMLPNHEFYAKELRDALYSVRTDDYTIAEILGALNSTEVENVAAVYSKVYATKLIDDLLSKTSGSFQKLLVKLCEGRRRDLKGGKVSKSDAENDTHHLILAGFDTELRHKNTEEETLINLLTTRAFPTLKYIFAEYANLTGENITHTISKRYTDPLANAFLTIVNRVISKSSFYANLLEQSMAGIGTDDRRLIRIIVGRSEIDLHHIIKTYQKHYNYPLIDRVSDDTSGSYRNLLMALIHKESY